MRLEKTKNAKRNILFGALNKFVTLLLPFFVRSVIIYVLTAGHLGLNGLFSSILQVLNLTELGFSSAVVYSMYKPIAENDEEKICALLNFYRKVYFSIGCIVLVIGIGLFPFLDFLISGEYPDDIDIHLIYFVYLFNTVISYFAFAYKNSLLNAHQRTDIISNINTITLGLLYVLQIIFLFVTKNYYVYIFLMPFFTIINNILIAIITKKMYPKYFCKGKISKETLSGIIKQISGLMVTKICAVTRNSFDSIFISAFFGLTVTAIYGNYYYIMSAIVGILTVISNGILAGVGNSIVTDSTKKNYNDMRKMNFLYMWITGWCTICLCCLYQPFMTLWVGTDLMFSFDIVICFCVYFYSLEMGVVRGVYSDAAGLWWQNRYRALAESIVNIVLNFCFALWFGVIGIIVATLISLIIINFGFGSQIVFKYYFKDSSLLKEYFIDNVKYALVTFIIGFSTFFACYFISVEGFLGLVIKALVCLVVPNILYVIIYYRTQMYNNSMKWILSSLHLDKKLKFLVPKH